jgi:hypothetical protein
MAWKNIMDKYSGMEKVCTLDPGLFSIIFVERMNTTSS